MTKYKKGEIVKDEENTLYKIVYVYKRKVFDKQYYDCVPLNRTSLQIALGYTETIEESKLEYE